MNKIFVHNPLFRLLSPLFSGVLVYILILLINNNVGQLQEEFLGQELYLCIGLSYLIQEFSRLSLLMFERFSATLAPFLRLSLQLFISLGLCVLLVSGSMYFYFVRFVGFSPNWTELWVFNSIFCGITLIYISLFLSYQYMFRENTQQMEKELSKTARVKEDFRQFKMGINPDLLFKSLEALIVNIRTDEDQAQALLGHLAQVYRYILSKHKEELVSFEQEWEVLEELVGLFNFLPFRKLVLHRPEEVKTWVVPGTLLRLIEYIVRSSIPARDLSLDIYVENEDERLCLSYTPIEKIKPKGEPELLAELKRAYAQYSDQPFCLLQNAETLQVCIPKLQVSELQPSM